MAKKKSNKKLVKPKTQQAPNGSQIITRGKKRTATNAKGKKIF